jgi:peptidoglycan-associated lipoprotein
MRARMWRIAMLGLLVFPLGAVGCATRPNATRPSVPPPSRFADGASMLVAANGGDAAGRPAPAQFSSVPELKDVYFEFDRADIGPAAARTLDASAEWLKAHPAYLVLVEGHTDERGTSEYNLALGDRRARASQNYLVSRGVPGSRFTVISYGEDRGVCFQHHERCWSRNRRAHFGVKPS